VQDIPDTPGRFRAIAYLRPHFQLEDTGIPLRVAVDLPPPAR
jgi:type VI secretion system protein ImpC